MPAMNLITDPSCTHGDVSDSPFLSLPPEMRNRIYEYVMTVDTVYVQLGRETRKLRGFVINEDDATLSQHDRRLKLVKSSFAMHMDSALQPAGGCCLSLLRTCKQVNKEAAKMFILCNSFEVQSFDKVSHYLADHGLLYPGIFLDMFETKSIVAAIPQFVAAIGPSDAKLLTDVTLHLGQFDRSDALDGEPKALVTIKHILDHLRSFQILNPSWHLKMVVALRISVGEPDEEIIEFQEVIIDVDAPIPGMNAAAESIQDRLQPLEPKSYVTDQLDAYASFLRKLQEAAKTWDE
ncbi:hypothetical protein LTR10_004196 [Elasticomyces elasticus]|nr:hypothetical protein LTR10_004196 [Elasticomyces elasticus]KAK4977621.1 hypothetical protein LTR42_001992 [Elasticomyces elasticus]